MTKAKPSKKPRLPRAARREQILRHAGRLFAERGLSGTRTRDLAKACGVNESILYRHFKSKEALFRAVLDAKTREHDIDGYLASLPPDEPVLETFKAVAGRILSIGLGDPVIQKLLLAATFEGSDETHRLYLTWRIPFVDFVEGIVRREIQGGRFKPVDPLLTARAFVGLVMDCVLNCNLWGELGYEDARPDQLIENNVPIFVSGLMKE